MRFFRSPNRNFLKKVIQSDPEREPKRAQKPPKWTLLDLTKHMVFTVRITYWADSVDLWEHVFSALLSGHCFFLGFVRLLRFWVPKGCPKGVRYSCGEWPKIDSVAKSLPGGPETPKGCPDVTKSDPKLMILLPKSHRNGPRVLLFQMHYEQHTDCTEILEYCNRAESFVLADDLKTTQRLLH